MYSMYVCFFLAKGMLGLMTFTLQEKVSLLCFPSFATQTFYLKSCVEEKQIAAIL